MCYSYKNFYIFRFFIKFLKEYGLYPLFFNFIKLYLIQHLGYVNRLQGDKNQYEEAISNLMIHVFNIARNYRYLLGTNTNNTTKALCEYFNTFDYRTVEALWLLAVAKNRKIPKQFRYNALQYYKNVYASFKEKQSLKLDKL